MSGPNDPVDFEEIILVNIISVAALLAVLDRKGVLTREEVIAKVR